MPFPKDHVPRTESVQVALTPDEAAFMTAAARAAGISRTALLRAGGLRMAETLSRPWDLQVPAQPAA